MHSATDTAASHGLAGSRRRHTRQTAQAAAGGHDRTSSLSALSLLAGGARVSWQARRAWRLALISVGEREQDANDGRTRVRAAPLYMVKVMSTPVLLPPLPAKMSPSTP